MFFVGILVKEMREAMVRGRNEIAGEVSGRLRGLDVEQFLALVYAVI